ncbi:MAG TPA: hypothetical protein VKR30_06115 [Candidatus Limnocylindrales bacterium]|nr:hypothetical protein [Candidatus Limnocylindrales bacterium]
MVSKRGSAAAVLAASMLLAFGAGIVNASGTYNATFCYDATNNQIVIEQVWSGMEVDTVTGGIGTKKGGLGFFNQITPATSGDETDSLIADPHAKTVGSAVLDQGATVGSATLNKTHGSWAKTMPAC